MMMMTTCIRVRDLRSRSMSSWFSEACAAVVSTSSIWLEASWAFEMSFTVRASRGMWYLLLNSRIASLRLVP